MFEALPIASPWALLIAFAIDRLLGELPSAVHPVAWLGRCAQRLADALPRRPALPALLAGGLLAVGVPVLVFTASLLVMRGLPDTPLRLGVESLLLSTTFAVRALGEAVLEVERRLSLGELQGAREALRGLCSRDARSLGPSQLRGAALQSAAENASDSVVAPVFYYLLLGLPGACAYRAINTLDAMFGYRGSLEHFGKAAARLDDLANLVPARLTALLLWLSARPLGTRAALAVWWRDAAATPSPNAGQPMAMMAGLLGVQLDKPGVYVLGRGLAAPSGADVRRGWSIVARASLLSVALAVVVAYAAPPWR